MKTISYILLVIFFLLSCSVGKKKDTIVSPVKELTKLEKLLLLPYDSVMNYCDLSDDSIVSFPDLSSFTIKSLDLSYNLLDTIKPYFLPEGLEKLNLSHNKYRGQLRIEENTMCTLAELDISYNMLVKIYVGEPLYRIIVSHNDLVEVDINHKHIQYLDISYNFNMSERVTFNPERIDTIVREGVANGKRLISPHLPFIIN